MSPQLHSLSKIWSAVLRECPLPPRACLFRTTEGENVERVRRYGTDRFGLDRPRGCARPPWTAADWAAHGFRGRWRPFVDVIYASTVADIERSLSGRGSSALIKIPDTIEAHLVIYRAAAFVPVHEGQYAFIDPARRVDAVLRILKVGG